jgi:hypothetical protein
MSNEHTSRLPGFYKRSLAERAAMVAQWAGLRPEEQISCSIERYDLVSRQAHRMPIHFSLLFDEVGYQETCISTL